MLEPPDLPDDALIACLHDAYGLHVSEITFLPLGADVNTAVYRAVAAGGTLYFVKLRRGDFDEAAVAIPRLLHQQGVSQVIAPLETSAGGLWTPLDPFTIVLYPFVAGQDGYDRPLSDRQWIDLGAALKGLHTAVVPERLTARLPRETYTPHWRDMVRMFLESVEKTTFDDPVSVSVAELLHTQRETISDLIARAERLAAALREGPLEYVLCHADIHAFNVLIDAGDVLHVVDWDTLMLAPKEHDLMYIGAGIGGIWNSPREEALFYQGYGPAQVDPSAIAYYRYERIVEDIAAYCEQLLMTDEGGDDREQSLRYLASNFLPNETIDVAYRSDRSPRAD